MGRAGSASDLDAGPFLHDARDRVKSDVGPNLALVTASIWRTAAPTTIGTPIALRLVDAQADVLVGEPGRKAEIKGARQEPI